jgi:hypothetical protein
MEKRQLPASEKQLLPLYSCGIQRMARTMTLAEKYQGMVIFHISLSSRLGFSNEVFVIPFLD